MPDLQHSPQPPAPGTTEADQSHQDNLAPLLLIDTATADSSRSQSQDVIVTTAASSQVNLARGIPSTSATTHQDFAAPLTSQPGYFHVPQGHTPYQYGMFNPAINQATSGDVKMRFPPALPPGQPPFYLPPNPYAYPVIPRVARIERKELPSFWPENVKLWFTSIETTFNSKQVVNDQSKYEAVIGRLDQEHLTAIEHIISRPPEQDKYKAIKDALIARYAMTQESSFRKLVSGLTLTGKKPSELYAEMCRLADNALDASFIRTLWLDRLPKDIQVTLTAAESLNNKDLALLADKMTEILKPKSTEGSTIAAVSRTEPLSEIAEQLQTLSEKVHKLSLRLDSMSNKGGTRGRSRSSNSSSSRSRSKSPNSSEKVCFYHRSFGDKAKKCLRPCSYESNQGNEASHQ